MCGLPKLGLHDQWLWAIMSSTNDTKLHTHEVAQCLWAWTPVLFRSSSSSYTWFTEKFTHFLSFFQKAIMVLIVLELHEPFWILVCLTHAPLFFEQLCVSFICSYFQSCSCCSHSCCSHSCCSFKLTLLILSKLAFLMLLFKVLRCFSPFWFCCSFKTNPLLALLLLLDQGPPLLPPFHSDLVQQVEPHRNMHVYLHPTSCLLSSLSSFWPSHCTCFFDIYNLVWVCKPISMNPLL